MSISETNELLKYWENTIDGVKWSEEDRQLTIDAITQSSMTLKEWKDFLVNVPNHVDERYRKVMKMLLDAELINEAAYEFELKVMDEWSPATGSWKRSPIGNLVVNRAELIDKVHK